MISFRSHLCAVSPPALASECIKKLLITTKLPAEAVQENQILNGLKSIMLAAQQVQLDHQQVVIDGGMESMSQVPYFLERGGELPYGGAKLIDGIVKDGLTDAYDFVHMGNCAEKTAKECGIGRAEQDEYAIQSYRRCAQAWQNGKIGAETFAVEVKTRKGTNRVEKDEEFAKVDFDKLKALKSVFQKENGTVTAGNASTMNDGAAAVVLASAEKAAEFGAKAMAKVIAYGDAATHPMDFPIVPAFVIPKIPQMWQTREIHTYTRRNSEAKISRRNASISQGIDVKELFDGLEKIINSKIDALEKLLTEGLKTKTDSLEKTTTLHVIAATNERFIETLKLNISVIFAVIAFVSGMGYYLGKKIDTMAEKVNANSIQLALLGTKVDSLCTKVDSLCTKVDSQGTKNDSQGQVDSQVQVGSQGTKVDKI